MRRVIETAIGFVSYYLGLTRFLLFITELFTGEKTLVAFVYHRVTDRSNGDVGYLIYDVGVDYRSFDVHVAAIKKHFQIVGLPEYIDCVSGRRQPDRRIALLTFDDTDFEFIKYALPVLSKHDCKSVVFAPTDFIGTDKLFWHLRVTNLARSVNSDGWQKLQSHAGQFKEQIAQVIRQSSVTDEECRAGTCRMLAHTLDQMDDEEVDSVVTELERIAAVKYMLGVTCMNWEQLAQIAKQGVAVESHTVSHRKLARLDEQTIRNELVESKRLLEQKLGNAVTAICYPAGSFNDTVVATASEAGYQAGFTTKPGLGSFALPGDERFRLRRVSMYGDSKYEADFHLAKMMLKRMLIGKSWS
ncbi:MAG: polysaccharide deacetylase family protein [Candidatus Zixiibacteriota bacterium]|nr:MAG: polysaccharide deacetylase family protein [candidate division Zixibacteria bacterium]